MKTLLVSILVAFSAASVYASAPTHGAAVSSADRVLYVCTARSLFGKRFSATGVDKVLAQEEAMQRCESYAFRCYRTGCSETSSR